MCSMVNDSPSAFFTSRHQLVSQESFSNTPFDSLVPETPNIARYQHSHDQQVPLTPVTQVIHRSPAISISIPTTPISAPTEPFLLVSNLNESSACLINIDQTVPSTPKDDCGTKNEVNYNESSISSHNPILFQASYGLCLDTHVSSESSASSSNEVSTQLKPCTRKRLALNRSRNDGCSNSDCYKLIAETAPHCPVQTTADLEPSFLCIAENSSQPSQENFDLLPESQSSSSAELFQTSLPRNTPPLTSTFPSLCRNTPPLTSTFPSLCRNTPPLTSTFPSLCRNTPPLTSTFPSLCRNTPPLTSTFPSLCRNTPPLTSTFPSLCRNTPPLTSTFPSLCRNTTPLTSAFISVPPPSTTLDATITTTTNLSPRMRFSREEMTCMRQSIISHVRKSETRNQADQCEDTQELELFDDDDIFM